MSTEFIDDVLSLRGYSYSKYTRPGIEPMPGIEWIEVHEHDLDGWTPTIEIDRPGSHYKFTIKDREAMAKVSKIIREK